MEHLNSLCLSLLAGSVSRMALLPKEFSRTQEETGTHLPTHHVSPLVAEDRQVAVGINPVLIGVPDDSLRSGSNDELLLQTSLGVNHHTRTVGVVLQTIVGHHSTLLGKALNMFSLSAEEALGNEQREVGVDVARLLEHFVKLALHLLPDGVTVRLDDHTAAHSRLLSQVSLNHQLIIPLRVILATFSQIFQFYCHNE